MLYTLSLVAVTCGSLGNIPDGYVEVDGTEFGSIASYACDSGFVLRGKGVRQCLESGAWSGDEPVCEGQRAALAKIVPHVHSTLEL